MNNFYDENLSEVENKISVKTIKLSYSNFIFGIV
jgi:hypothetical protein